MNSDDMLSVENKMKLAHKTLKSSLKAVKQSEKTLANAKQVINDAKEKKDNAREVLSKCKSALNNLRQKPSFPNYLEQERQLQAKLKEAQGKLETAKHLEQVAHSLLEQQRENHQKVNTAYLKAKQSVEDNKRLLDERLTELRKIAVKAGVPECYLADAQYKMKDNGGLEVYCASKTFGNDHGHYVISKTGKLTYARKPGAPRGANNYL